MGRLPIDPSLLETVALFPRQCQLLSFCRHLAEAKTNAKLTVSTSYLLGLAYLALLVWGFNRTGYEVARAYRAKNLA